MGNNEIVSLANYRELVGKPSPAEVGMFMKTAVEIKLGAIEAMSKRAVVKDQLAAFKAQMEVNRSAITEDTPSQSDLCGAYITTFVLEPYQQIAAEQRQEDNTPEFRFYSDFAEGINEVVSALYEAEQVSAGRITQVFQEQRAANESVLDESELDTRADDFAVFSKEAERRARLFEIPPTGFLLVDKVVAECASEESLAYSSRSREYMLAGAEFAAFLYKNSYEITSKLYP